MRTRLLLAVGFLLLVAGLGVAVTRGGPSALDADLSRSLRGATEGATRAALEALSWTFSSAGRWVTVGVALLLVGWLRGPRRALFVGFAMLATWGLITAAKDNFPRARPDGGAESYPSGHVAQTAALAGALALVFSRPGKRILPVALAVAAIALMAWSRIGLGRHWPTDTVGGALLGTATWVAVRTAFIRSSPAP